MQLADDLTVGANDDGTERHEGVGGVERVQGEHDDCRNDTADATDDRGNGRGEAFQGTCARGDDGGEPAEGTDGRTGKHGPEKDDMTEDNDQLNRKEDSGKVDGEWLLASFTMEDDRKAVADFMWMMLTKEVASTFNLKQVTCTVDENLYWSEHIGAENDSTTHFGHIPIGTSAEVADCRDECSDADEDEDDFGMS